MKYSVLMAVYEKENKFFFESAIKSILEQTRVPNEFVVVCDGPLTEELDKVLLKYKTQYPSLFKIIRIEENVGLGLALREGVIACSNELIMRMDSDDLSIPERAQIQLDYLYAHPDVSLVGGQIYEFEDEPNHIISQRCVPTEHHQICQTLRFRNPINHVTVFMRKSAVLDVGNYESYLGFEDYQLWAKMTQKYRISNLNCVLCYVRTHKMLQRRSGQNYYRCTYKFMRFLLDNGTINKMEFARNIIIRYFFSIIPIGHFKSTLFRFFMRKSIA